MNTEKKYCPILSLDLGSSIHLLFCLSIARLRERKGKKNAGGANKRPIRFSNEIIKTALNLPRILPAILLKYVIRQSKRL